MTSQHGVAPTLGLEQQKGVLRHLISRNFRLFFYYGFGALDYCRNTPEDAWVYGPFHDPYLDFLNKHFWRWQTWRKQGIRKPLKIMTEVFRGGGKSTIGNAFDLFIHINAPNTVQILSSYDKLKAADFLSVNKAYMEGKGPYGLFTDLWPNWVPENFEQVWRAAHITHNYRTNQTIRDPSISLASIQKGIAGVRPDYIRLDDPIFAEKISVEEVHVEQARKHFDANKWALKSNGLYFLDLTPYTDTDVAAKVWHEDGVASVHGQKPKFEYKQNPDGWHVWYSPVRDESGHTVLPNVYPDERLRQMEEEDPDDFAAQMMLDPASGASVPLRMKDVEKLRVPKAAIPEDLEISIHCDTAWKSSENIKKGDNNVIQMWGFSPNSGLYYFLRGLYDNTWTGPEFFVELCNILKELWQSARYPYILTFDKENSGLRGSFEAQLLDWCRRYKIPCPACLPMPRSPNFKKDDRIRHSVTNWKAGRVRLLRGAPGENQLIYEMTHVGYSSKRDMADAAADLWHPEVFRAGGNSPSLQDDLPPVERPFDRELWAQSGILLDDQLRDAYDTELNDVSEGARDLDDLLEGRVVQ